MQEFFVCFIEQGIRVEKNILMGTCYLKSQAISLNQTNLDFNQLCIILNFIWNMSEMI